MKLGLAMKPTPQRETKTAAMSVHARVSLSNATARSEVQAFCVQSSGYVNPRRIVFGTCTSRETIRGGVVGEYSTGAVKMIVVASPSGSTEMP